MDFGRHSLNILGIVLATAISYLVPLLIDLGSESFLSSSSSQTLVALGGLIGTVVLVVYQQAVFARKLISDERQRHKRELDQVHATAVQIVLDFCRQNIAPSEDAVRVCLFLLDNEADTLTMFPCVSGNFRPCEKNLVFKEHEGGVGYAMWHWRTFNERQLTLHIDLSGNKHEVITRWRLTERQHECTKDVKQLITVPLRRDTDPHDLLGILSIDTELERSELDLNETDTGNMALEFARLLEGLFINHKAATE